MPQNRYRKPIFSSICICFLYLMIGVLLAFIIYCFFYDYYSQSKIKSTNYTIEEINSMALPEHNRIGDEEKQDYSSKALKAYNKMLGYVESVIGQEYYIYDYYMVNFTNRKSYVIKIIPAQWKDTPGECKEIMLSSKLNGSHIRSGLIYFLMARKQFEDLQNDMKNNFPEYHVNLEYNKLDYLVPSINQKFPKDVTDYTFYYNPETFYSEKKYITRDNMINVIVPYITQENQAEDIYESISPILKKYCITEVCIVSPVSEEAFEAIIRDEQLDANIYLYKHEVVSWYKQFYVR